MNTKTAVEQSFDDAYEDGRSSALAMIANGKPVLAVDEVGLCDLKFANACGWNSVFASAENGKLLRAAKSV